MSPSESVIGLFHNTSRNAEAISHSIVRRTNGKSISYGDLRWRQVSRSSFRVITSRSRWLRTRFLHVLNLKDLMMRIVMVESDLGRVVLVKGSCSTPLDMIVYLVYTNIDLCRDLVWVMGIGREDEVKARTSCQMLMVWILETLVWPATGRIRTRVFGPSFHKSRTERKLGVTLRLWPGNEDTEPTTLPGRTRQRPCESSDSCRAAQGRLGRAGHLGATLRSWKVRLIAWINQAFKHLKA